MLRRRRRASRSRVSTSPKLRVIFSVPARRNVVVDPARGRDVELHLVLLRRREVELPQHRERIERRQLERRGLVVVQQHDAGFPVEGRGFVPVVAGALDAVDVRLQAVGVIVPVLVDRPWPGKKSAARPRASPTVVMLYWLPDARAGRPHRRSKIRACRETRGKPGRCAAEARAAARARRGGDRLLGRRRRDGVGRLQRRRRARRRRRGLGAGVAAAAVRERDSRPGAGARRDDAAGLGFGFAAR